MKSLFNIAEIHSATPYEGPFLRCAIWFQGCVLACPQCCNPELQPLVRNHSMSSTLLLEEIEKSKRDCGIEGVTFLGGEPTLQQQLHELAREVQQRDLGVLLFTGYSLAQLETQYPSLLSVCDMVVDGGYDPTQIDTQRNLIGSTNQKIHCLTPRYENQLDWFTTPRKKGVMVDVVEGRISFCGDVF